MVTHIIIYKLKCLLRDRVTLFWTLMFPIILATLFNMALSNINSSEAFKAIDIAVVDDINYQKDQSFRLALEQVSKGNDRLFNLNIVTKSEAEKMLNDNKIAGYIIVESPIKLVVNKSGFDQNIIKSFIDYYIQTLSTVNTLIKNNTADTAKQQDIIKDLGTQGEYTQFIKEISASSAEPDIVLTYFYSLIAMACFYGGFWGMQEVARIQADISPLAARINIAPVHKLKTFIYSMGVSLLVHFTEMLILLAYLYFVLKVDFGQKTNLVLLTTFLGSIAGVSFGTVISAIVKKSENVKVAVLIGISMTCSFLAGMMQHSIKYTIARKAPLLSYLNPVNLLTDAFYSLYYYDTLFRYILNMGILTIITFLFCLGTYLIIRRRKYASL
ncbi:MAG TPA: ABC transporter permease [Clostridiaceae bacterium]|nr:ABC transporter permease [Clostridiaceae bacterium]